MARQHSNTTKRKGSIELCLCAKPYQQGDDVSAPKRDFVTIAARGQFPSLYPLEDSLSSSAEKPGDLVYC